MGRHCCVLGCNTAVNLPSHAFPKDANMMNKWRKAIYSNNIKDLSDEELRKYVVCYKHFADNDYEATYKLRRLKPGVIPSLYLNNSDDINKASNNSNVTNNDKNSDKTNMGNNSIINNNADNKNPSSMREFDIKSVKEFEINTKNTDRAEDIEEIEIIEIIEDIQSPMEVSQDASTSAVIIPITKASAANAATTELSTASISATITPVTNAPTTDTSAIITPIASTLVTKISTVKTAIASVSASSASTTTTSAANTSIASVSTTKTPAASTPTTSTLVANIPTVSTPMNKVSEKAQSEEKYSTHDILDLHTVLQEKHFHKFTPKMWKLYKLSCILRKKQEAVVKRQLSFRERIRQAKQYSKSPAIEKLLSSLTPVQRTFLEMQIKTTNYAPKDKRFTLDEKIAALSIMKQSSKCYQHLTQVFNLPDISTLRSILQKVNIHPGPINFINQRLKEQVRFMKEKDKVCLLMWDKMLLQPHLDFDATKKHILGFEDFGNKRSARFADHVLVFMVRGIQSGWKLPLAYYFCDGATKTDQLIEWIKDITKIIIDSGLYLAAFICDDGKRNLAAINKLKLDSARLKYKRGELYYGYITIKNQDIIPIYDPPHLIRSVRNNLSNSDLEFDCVEGEERKFASWEIIEQAYHMDLTHNVYRLMPKITAEHIMKNKMKEKKVKTAVQILSRTMGAFIHHHTKLQGHINTIHGPLRMPEKKGRNTAEIILFFDRLFDSVNGHALKSEKSLRVAISHNSPHFVFWEKTIKRLQRMQFVDSKEKKPLRSSITLKNWISTIRGFRKLWKIMKVYEFKCLKPRMLNQDCLRHFFGQIRSFGVRNTNPTCAEFENSFKTLLINNLTSPRPVENNNEHKVDGTLLFTLKGFIGKEKKRDFKLMENLQMLELEIEAKPMGETYSHFNICNSIALKILNNSRIKGCDSCRKLLTDAAESNLVCSKNLLEAFENADNILTQVMSKACYLHHTALMLETELYVHSNLCWVSCQQHKVPLKELLISYMVVFYIYKWCNGINNILIVKDQND